MQKLFVLGLIYCLTFFCLANSAMAAGGDLDSTFGNSGQVTTDFQGHGGVARAVTMLSNRKVIVGGSAFTGDFFFHSDFGLARYNLDGSLDTSFGSGGKVMTDFFGDQDEIHGLAIQPDGKIVAVGKARDGATIYFGLARYNPNGSLDTTFGLGGKVVTNVVSSDSDAMAVVIQPDGKIVAGGRGTDSSNTSIDFALARYNPNGSIDTTFGSSGKVVTDMGGFDLVLGLVRQPDGKLVAAGYCGNGASRDDFALARYNPDGSLDSTFGSGGKVRTDFFLADDRGRSIALQDDGYLIVGGSVRPNSSPFDDRNYFGLARYKPDGSLDTSFGTLGKVTTDFSQYSATFAESYALAIQADNKIVSAGWTNLGFALARYDSDGSLDDTFGNQGTVITSTPGPLYAAVIQPDSKLFVAGGNGAGGFSLARYLTTATDAPILQIEANSANAVAIDSVTFAPAPFSVTNDLNFSPDHRTRIILFAANLTLANGENASSVTVQAQTSGGPILSLPVEYVGVVPGSEWFTQVVVRLPDALANAGTVQVSITHGNTSNQGSIFIK